MFDLRHCFNGISQNMQSALERRVIIARWWLLALTMVLSTFAYAFRHESINSDFAIILVPILLGVIILLPVSDGFYQKFCHRHLQRSAKRGLGAHLGVAAGTWLLVLSSIYVAFYYPQQLATLTASDLAILCTIALFATASSITDYERVRMYQNLSNTHN